MLTNETKHRDITAPGDDAWDVVIAGAGPAGLFTALSLAAAGVERVLLLDAGPDMEDRREADHHDGDRRGRVDYERGVGGAGLFSDGKLCLSLDVGGHLETGLDAATRSDLLANVEAVFAELAQGITPRTLGEEDAEIAARTAAEAGLAFKYYPVAHIGTDRCHDVIRRLRSVIEAGGTVIRADTELVDVVARPSADCKRAVVRNAQGDLEHIPTRNLVLALGKVGAAREAAILQRLGVEVASQPLYAGVRFEASSEALEPLFSLTKDPKYSLRLPGGDKIKTHCASEHGEVIALCYSGLPLAGGHNYSDARTERSGFSILWDGVTAGPDAYATALSIMARVKQQAGHGLLVQRLADYREGRASTSAALAGMGLSYGDGVAGDIRDILPTEYFPLMDEFLERMELLAPDLSREAVMYAPAIEWWMKRVAVDNRLMETAVSGVYACGDGSGWSQGIVHAAATGLLAATGIHGQPTVLGPWVRDLVTAGVA